MVRIQLMLAMSGGTMVNYLWNRTQVKGSIFVSVLYCI